jgi:hypothetical protein
MSTRVQVLLDESELKEIRRLARRHRMTVAAWVRQALSAARRQVPGRDASRKLAALRSAVAHTFPSADMDQLNAEIERGYGEVLGS